MISVSANNHALWANTSQEKPQLQQQVLSGSINHISNLPLELKHRIVSYLNYKDYASLREACVNFQQEFPDMDSMRYVLNKGICKGEYKRELTQRLSVPNLERTLQDDTLMNIRLAIQNIRVRHTTPEGGKLIISTEYLPKLYCQNKSVNIPQAIQQCQKLLPALAHWSTDRSAIFTGFEFQVCANSLTFLESEIDAETMKKVFSAFNEAWHAIKGDERVLIAALASATKKAWLDTPPAGLSQADVKACAAPFSDLFYVGDTARDAAEKIKKPWLGI